jgi:DNA-binding CsgD family transcriptional regulator
MTTQALKSILVIENSIFWIDMLSAMATESFYIVDVAANRFCYVSQNDLFLCGHSVNDALALGDDFYKKIVYPDDWALWERMRKAVLLYLKTCGEKEEDIDYFSCTFRLQHKFSLVNNPLRKMIHHKIKPVWKDDELRYLICSIESVVTKETGNLRVYCNNRLIYEKYNFTTGRWKLIVIDPLTELEEIILTLSMQGENTKKIANYLCKGHHTIRNRIKALFKKLGVNTMQEAADLVIKHRMMCVSKKIISESEKLPVKTTRKKSQFSLCLDSMQRIQQALNFGYSIRQTAKQEHIAESSIRYWIKQGKLKIVK